MIPEYPPIPNAVSHSDLTQNEYEIYLCLIGLWEDESNLDCLLCDTPPSKDNQ